MASSSSASASSPERWTYDVFLSFRGEDTRKTFVDHLYTALVDKDVNTYKDDITLERGRSISPELLQAINEARCAIIVFSPNYASSSWCLDELVHIMESMRNNSQIVFPVFHDVEPTDVRKQKGHFGEEFSKHKTERVEVWRKALFEASNLSGWETRKFANGHEAQCIKDIVRSVSLELQGMHSRVDEDLVGMESRIQNLQSSLGIGLGGVRMIGIWGMGGGGKTTLARAIYDQYSKYFDNYVFVENVREVSQKIGLQHLQNQILSAVDKDIIVNNVSDGIQLMRRRLCKKKILIVLDDVDHLEQLQALAGKSSWFCEGGRIIITTRDQRLLVAHQVDEIHNVSLLNREEALTLFCKYAFRKNVPLEGYEEASKEVLRYAAGLPLTLKVLGSLFCGNELPIWRSALSKLKKIPENETLKKLEISFDSLDDLQKETFLDIAYFFREQPIAQVSAILDGCGLYATADLRVLEQKSLINVKDSKCYVHDLLVELAMVIVRRVHPNQPWKHSRLTDPEEVLDVLKNKKGTEEIKTLVVKIDDKQEHVNLGEAFRNMKNLRLLHAYIQRTSEGPIYFPEELRALRFSDYPLKFLPETFEGRNLVNLVLSGSRIHGLREKDIKQSFKNLMFLTIRNSEMLSTTPDFMSMPNLKWVSFVRCNKLREVHSSVGNLHNLVQLDLSLCGSLLTLPGSISELKSLERLTLLFCVSLQELPENMGSSSGLAYLNHLDLEHCWDLKYLPPHIGRLPCLQTLLLHCTKVVELPDSICLLDCLSSLNLDMVPISRLPDTLGETRFLRELTLNSCHKFERLPESICQLKCLRTLKLSHCDALKELPLDLGNIECLEELEITSAIHLSVIPDSICRLKFLRTLVVHLCLKLTHMPRNLESLECLEVLVLSWNHIELLPDGICELTRLRSLDISGLSFQILPDCICGLKQLKTLRLEVWKKLMRLPVDLGNLESLEELYLSSCETIDALPDSICRLKRLKKLDVHKCSNLKELPSDLVKMECLKEIDISRSGITNFPSAMNHLLADFHSDSGESESESEDEGEGEGEGEGECEYKSNSPEGETGSESFYSRPSSKGSFGSNWKSINVIIFIFSFSYFFGLVQTCVGI